MAFHTLYVWFIKVLGHLGEVGASEASAEAPVWHHLAHKMLHLSGDVAQPATSKCGVVGGPSRVPDDSFAENLCFFQILSTMARRPRSSRAWHFVLSAAHRDADARAMALAGTTNWGYDSDGQVGGYGWIKVWRPGGRSPPTLPKKLLPLPPLVQRAGTVKPTAHPGFTLVKDPHSPGMAGPQDRLPHSSLYTFH